MSARRSLVENQSPTSDLEYVDVVAPVGEAYLAPGAEVEGDTRVSNAVWVVLPGG